MLEKIKQQINEIETILEGLKNKKEDIDKYLKENKYTKKITEKHFKNDQAIISEIKKNKELITELKHNHIKLTESQKETEKSHKQYIEEINRTLNSTLKLLKKLELEKTYIDQEIIDILDLNEIENLKDIIEFNKIITLKKKGFTQKEEQIEEIVEKETKIENEKQNQPKQEKKEKPKKEEKIEKILLYNNIGEINEFLKKNYQIEIKTERDIEELNKILEIIENSSIKELNKNLIKEILEKTEIDVLESLNEMLNESGFEAKEIEEIKDIFTQCEKPQAIIRYILNYNDMTKQEKQAIINKSEQRREKFVKNRTILISYGIKFEKFNALLNEISLEKIDQLIELGHTSELKFVAALYNKNKSLVENIQFEDYLSKKRYDHLYEFLFSGLIYNLIVEIDESTYDTTNVKKAIFENLKKDKRFKSKLIMGEPDLKQLASKNEILKKEEETSKKSIDNFLFTIFPYPIKEANMIYEENNKYLQLIDQKFTKKDCITYGIKINKKFVESEIIQISKPKVLRLLNQHHYEGHEITKDIVKQCMLYNLITTDEILNEVDRILTEEFELLDQKVKRK